MTAPLMISSRDEHLVGVARRSDPMGVLAVWRARARSMVPHLTEQTTDVRGFQILVEAFRLWTIYLDRELQRSEGTGLPEFFMLVEQAFARTVGCRDRKWPFPGARRVQARLDYSATCISVADAGWHLLGDQLASGIWGLYRGAAGRAGLLDDGMAWLSEDTFEASNRASYLQDRILERLLDLVGRAMCGETVELPMDGRNALPRALRRTFDEVTLSSHLREKLIDSHDLNQAIAERLVCLEDLKHRAFLEQAALELDEHHGTLREVIDCENLLAILEGIFFCLCHAKGTMLQEAAGSLPLDLGEIEAARHAFAGNQWATRFDELDTASRSRLVHSVLSMHKTVCDERGRAAWVWEEQCRLRGDFDAGKPTEDDCKVGVAWRNDYYLSPLRSIALQLKELGA